MRKNISLLCSFFLFSFFFIEAQVREEIAIADDWKFSKSGLGTSQELGIYTTTFNAVHDYYSKKTFLRFEGMNFAGEFFLNGKSIGADKGLDTPFFIDISNQLSRGGNKLELRTKLSASSTDDIILIRPSYLLITRPICFNPLNNKSEGPVSILKISKQDVDLNVGMSIDNGFTSDILVDIRIRLFDQNNNLAASLSNPLRLQSASSSAVEIKLNIPNPILWQGQENPHLYRAEIEIWENEELLDNLTQLIAMRSSTYDPTKGFLLNDKEYPLRLVDCAPLIKDGAYVFSREQDDRDFYLAKSLGANALQSDGPHFSDYFLALCEKEGIICQPMSMAQGAENNNYSDLANCDYAGFLFDTENVSLDDIAQGRLDYGGLVSYDRTQPSDAYRYYQLKWTTEPFIHICDKDKRLRNTNKADIKIYANFKKIWLRVNGVELGSKSSKTGVYNWGSVPLSLGNNLIEIRSLKDANKKPIYEDSCEWTYLDFD